MTIDNRPVQGGSAAPVYLVNHEVNVSTAGNGAAIITEPYNIAVARGIIAGVSSDRKFGRAPSADTTYRTIWDGNGATSYSGFDVAAGALSVVSASANDAAAGTGMRTMRVEGLDANYALQTEDFTLNGTTPVAGALTFLRVFRAYGLTGGSGQTNAGNITVSRGGTTVAIIEAGYGQTSMAVYTVPAGLTFELIQTNASVGANKTAQYLLETREYLSSLWRVRESWEITNAAYTPPDRAAPLEIPARTDIRLRGRVTTGTGEINGLFAFFLRSM